MLVARWRDLDVAEEALADAFEAAARTWPSGGVPEKPAAWVMTVAQRSALDRYRRRGTALRALPLLVAETRDREEGEAGMIEPGDDDELRLLLLTCHPALAASSQAALALRLVLGVPTSEIARLFLVSEATLAARITRAKRKVHAAGLPLRLPSEDRLSERLSGALDTMYLCFTAGYAPGEGPDVVRMDLAGEAIRLVRLLIELLRVVSGDVEEVRRHARALLALMLLQHSRRRARVDAEGGLIVLAEQDRGKWDAEEIAEGLALLDALPTATGKSEEVRLQAALAAEHARARTSDETDWTSIASTYAELERLSRSPIVRLNRAVAVAESVSPEAGLAVLEGLDELLPASHRLPAVRGELLARAGRATDARTELERALGLCRNEPERRYLRQRIATLLDG